MTTPLDVYRQAWVDYWAKHLGPSYNRPGGNSYECDWFVAQRVFAAGQRSVANAPVPEPDREREHALECKEHCDACGGRGRPSCGGCGWQYSDDQLSGTLPGPEPDREALGRAAYDGVFGGYADNVADMLPWASAGPTTRRVCIETGERLYELGRASRDAEVAELRKAYDARGEVLARYDRQLESYKEEIADLCVDKASLTDRLASANRWVAELEEQLRDALDRETAAECRLEQQQKPAPAEDRRCGTCMFADHSWHMPPCCNCSCSDGYSHWQKR